MATALFSRNSKGRRVVREEAETVEAQLAQLRDDIASLAKIVSRDASSGVETVKGRVRGVRGKAARIQGDAESHMHDLIAAGEEALSDLGERYRQSGREVRRTVREHPVATIGTALAAGFVLAALLRR
jgi:ElaB/YqjD/DUF883 family membrane-anchored ribosome-binding protein